VRLREAAKLGFKSAIVPKRLRKGEPGNGYRMVEARSVQQPWNWLSASSVNFRKDASGLMDTRISGRPMYVRKCRAGLFA